MLWNVSTIWQSLTTKYYSESYYRSSAHNLNLKLTGVSTWRYQKILCKVISCVAMAAMLVSLNKETAAMLVSATNPQGIELCSYMQMLFCIGWKKFSLITRMKALYKRQCTTIIIIIIVIISIILLFECVSLSYLLYCKIQWS